MESITVRNEDIVNAAEALRILSGEKLPTLLAVKVMRMMRVVIPEAQIIGERRNEIVDRWMMRDAEGKPVPATDRAGREIPDRVKVTDEKAAQADLLELLGGSAELVCPTLSLKEFEFSDRAGNPFMLEPQILYGLGPFLNGSGT